jgi:putative sterol carrier protein
MADAVDDFFRDLDERGDEPLLRTVTGTVRFDVTDDAGTDHWLLALDRGSVSARHEGGQADCVIGGQEPLVGDIVQGRANAMAALLRGELSCTGDLELIFAVQRLFAGPDDPTHPAGNDHG